MSWKVNYNPTKNWTISASATKTEAINTAVGSAVDDYIAARMPIWTTLEDPRFTQTTQTIGGITTAIHPHQSADRRHRPLALVEYPRHALQHGGRLQRHELGRDELRCERRRAHGRFPRSDRSPAAPDPQILRQVQHRSSI